MVQCALGSDTGDKLTVGCLVHDFKQSSTFEWTDTNRVPLISEQYPPAQRNNIYTGLSFIQVSKRDWSSKKSFLCSVKHGNNTESVEVKNDDQASSPSKVNVLSVQSGEDQMLVCSIQDIRPQDLQIKWKKNSDYLSQVNELTLQKNGETYSAVSILKVSKSEWDPQSVYLCEVTDGGRTYTEQLSKALVSVTLTRSNLKEIHNNNQAAYQCVVKGQDTSVLSGTTIEWQIDGRLTTDNIKHSNTESVKTSTLTMTRSQFSQVSKVSCSAVREGRTLSTQELTVHRGDESEPKVSVYILPETDSDQTGSADVTLVCLVSSSVLQDYYVAWTENHGQTNGVYKDGITTPSQKTKNGYLVTSVYTTTRANWNSGTYLFKCNVWTSRFNKSQGVSKSMGCLSETSFALSCTDQDTEDEISSLWSTTSTFIFLFIFSLFYSMIFSLIKMKG